MCRKVKMVKMDRTVLAFYQFCSLPASNVPEHHKRVESSLFSTEYYSQRWMEHDESIFDKRHWIIMLAMCSGIEWGRIVNCTLIFWPVLSYHQAPTLSFADDEEGCDDDFKIKKSKASRMIKKMRQAPNVLSSIIDHGVAQEAATGNSTNNHQ